MTFRGLVLRFAGVYAVSLVAMSWLAALFVNKNALVVTTAALLVSTLIVCQSFCRRNGRVPNRREMLQAWLAFLAIDLLLQLLAVFSFTAPFAENLARLRQFVGGGFIPLALFHGICLYAFILLSVRVAANKLIS